MNAMACLCHHLQLMLLHQMGCQHRHQWQTAERQTQTPLSEGQLSLGPVEMGKSA